jgi:hypothetical protein
MHTAPALLPGQYLRVAVITQQVLLSFLPLTSSRPGIHPNLFPTFSTIAYNRKRLYRYLYGNVLFTALFLHVVQDLSAQQAIIQK